MQCSSPLERRLAELPHVLRGLWDWSRQWPLWCLYEGQDWNLWVNQGCCLLGGILGAWQFSKLPSATMAMEGISLMQILEAAPSKQPLKLKFPKLILLAWRRICLRLIQDKSHSSMTLDKISRAEKEIEGLRVCRRARFPQLTFPLPSPAPILHLL